MDKFFFTIAILSIVCIPIYSQECHIEEENISINPHPSHSTEMRFQIHIRNLISLCSIRVDPRWLELSACKDSSIKVMRDSTFIYLKSGTAWNPEKTPPQCRFFLFKYIAKLDSINTINRLNYLEILSSYEHGGNYFSLIDIIFFRNSYYSSENKKLMTIDFELKPDSLSKIGMSISKRDIIFSNLDCLSQ